MPVPRHPTDFSAAELMPPRRTTPALLMSLVLHVIVLTTLGLFWNRLPSGSGAEEVRSVGIAFVHRMPDRDRYVDAAPSVDHSVDPSDQSESVAAESVAAESVAAESSSAASNPPPDFAPPIDLAGILHSIESIPTPQSGTGLAGETDLNADALGSDALGAGPPGGPNANASATTTTVFGVSGSGSRFVYVFDRSDSMNGHGGNPLRQAKRELIRSLQTLNERHQFQIVFYNDKPTPFKLGGLPLQMIRAEAGYLREAESYVRSISAFGGTSHEDALQLAIRMGPDVIFFLTDARIPRLSAKQLREIMTRASSAGTTIHAIEFGNTSVVPDNSFLRELAEMNRGEYRYIDIRNFQPNQPPNEPASK